MAKKYEFRPDKGESSILNKLYMTKQQRLALLRWALLALVLLVTSLLQDVILCQLDIFGATTDLVPCAIFLIAVQLGVERGCVFSLVSACFFQFSGSGPGYHAIAVITALCICGAMFRQSVMRKTFSGCALVTAVCLVLYELIIFAVGLLLGQTVLSRVGVALLTALLSLVALPAIYPISRAIDKIGGEAWKD